MDTDSVPLTVTVPSAVSALCLGPKDVLCAGDVDGCVRWYNLPSTKVFRAIRSLGNEVSSLVWAPHKKNENGSIWIASGRRVLSFPETPEKLISTPEDASHTLAILEESDDPEDVLNELCISDTGKYLAFCTDSGLVGVIDIESKTTIRMKHHHNAICGSVKFIPDRPNEMISGGFDSALLHFDIGQRNVLSRFDIVSPEPADASAPFFPPFVLSVSVSPAGILAVSTADGRVWIGGGGEKRLDPKKKRSRKWEGLKDDEGVWLQVANGAVVSCVFTQNDCLYTCSLLGVVVQYIITRDPEHKLQAAKSWSVTATVLKKVNGMVANQSYVALGGISKEGKGAIEVWRVSHPTLPTAV